MPKNSFNVNYFLIGAALLFSAFLIVFTTLGERDGTGLITRLSSNIPTPSEPPRSDSSAGNSLKPGDISVILITSSSRAGSAGIISSSADPSDFGSKMININTATEAELRKLDGIGQVLARRIIEYRETRSSFKKKEDIMQVKGIGQGIFEKIKDYITTD